MDKVRLKAALDNGTFSQDEIDHLSAALDTHNQVQDIKAQWMSGTTEDQRATLATFNWQGLLTALLPLIALLIPSTSPIAGFIGPIINAIIALFGGTPTPTPGPAPAPVGTVKPTPVP